MNYNWEEESLKKYFLTSNEIAFNIELDTYRLIALKKIIDIFTNSDKSWEYFLGDERKHQLRIIIDNIGNIRWGKIKEISTEYSKMFTTHICYDVENFNTIYIQTYMKQIKKGENPNNYESIINEINTIIYNEIVYIYENVKKCDFVENYFFEMIQLRKGDFIGYYDFNRIKIDCGAKIDAYYYPRILKCQIKYFKIICPRFKYFIPTIETMDIDRKIIYTLMQLFLRCSFNMNISNGKYFSFKDNRNENLYELDLNHIGKINDINRDKIITEDYDGIPSDTTELIEKFYKLDYDRQNLFLMSCDAYAEAQKSTHGKAITFYTIALESLANDLHDKKYKNIKMSKKKRINVLFRDTYDKDIISQDFIDYIYSIRCLFSHEGIANNRIKQEIFGVEDADKMLERYLEEITYSTLTKWLINQEI